MAYSLLAPGKRLRPLLVLLACEAAGGESADAALPAGGGRRDGPYVFADSRRPAGDGRRRPPPRPADLPQAVRRGAGHPGRRRAADAGLSGAGRGLPAGDRRRLLPWNWRAGAGAAGMVGGQVEDLAWENDPTGAIGDLERIHARKTGALFRACLRLGAVVAGAASGGSGSAGRATAASSARRSRSPTTCSTSKDRRPTPARRSARTRPAAS